MKRFKPNDREGLPGSFFMPAGKALPDGESYTPEGHHYITDRDFAEARRTVVPLLIKEQRVVAGLAAGGLAAAGTAALLAIPYLAGQREIPVQLAGVAIGALTGIAGKKAGRFIQAKYRIMVAIEALLGCALIYFILLFAESAEDTSFSAAEISVSSIAMFLVVGLPAMCIAYLIAHLRLTRGEIVKRHFEVTGRLTGNPPDRQIKTTESCKE